MLSSIIVLVFPMASNLFTHSGWHQPFLSMGTGVDWFIYMHCDVWSDVFCQRISSSDHAAVL